ncbi:LysR family transcriptional regulator [Qingshengfaniella alkalisoli]|uniref:LysR family transcriptional regulator n=1 Tax=Qingshengfaniella alkalisoli TaxID=2599296 RepID=A0A5B8J3Y3_9RHOB|nr:LysR family transcriptional regulator [Qingshengfaniella alkalisoli]QDY71418.1 LysR family transcriptional regulator [Qingshengfaniella alkalisoli]
MRGNDIAQLRVFLAVLDHGGFRRAAPHLGMTPSAVSQSIRTLEERLGQRLLNRTTRSIAPTEAGQQLRNRITPALAEIAAAEDELLAISDRVTGRVRITAPRVGAEHVLAPRLASFHAAYPGVKVEIVVSETLDDAVAGGFDAGLRLGDSLGLGMRAVPVGGPARMVVVAAPAYLAQRGLPETPEALCQHSCLNFPRPSTGVPWLWEFEQNGQCLQVFVDGPLISTDACVLLRAAIEGAGIAFLFEQDAASSIASGRLQALLTDWTPRFPGFHLYYAGTRLVTPALRAFIDHLTKRRTP